MNFLIWIFNKLFGEQNKYFMPKKLLSEQMKAIYQLKVTKEKKYEKN